MLSAAIYKHPAAITEEINRNAYNAAFCELGLRWHWDSNTYQNLLSIAGEKDRIRVYVETEQQHLLKAYDADFLIDAIQTAKARCYGLMIAHDGTGAPYLDLRGMQSLEAGA